MKYQFRTMKELKHHFLVEENWDIELFNFTIGICLKNKWIKIETI